MAFRLLYTLERCGMIEKVGENLYRSYLRPFKQKLYRLGYAAQGTDYQFSKEISTGLQRAAQAEGIELICVDNRYSGEDRAAKRRRPRAGEGGSRHRVPDRRTRCADCRREAPRGEHPADCDRDSASRGDLFRREQLRGRPDRRPLPRSLGEAAVAGDVDEIVLITLERAGSLPRMRLTGMLVGMSETFRRSSVSTSPTSTATARWRIRSRRCAATCDQQGAACSSARSTIRARLAHCARSGSRPHACVRDHGAERLARRTRGAAQPGTRLIGSVAYFPEVRARIVGVALDILHHRAVPPAVFVKHQLVTPENVNHIYPNDD